jgi:hypothetical protein
VVRPSGVVVNGAGGVDVMGGVDRAEVMRGVTVVACRGDMPCVMRRGLAATARKRCEQADYDGAPNETKGHAMTVARLAPRA